LRQQIKEERDEEDAESIVDVSCPASNFMNIKFIVLPHPTSSCKNSCQ